MNHPELLDLELLRTGEADEVVERHVEACAECQASLAELRGLAESAAAGLPVSIPEEVDRRILWQARKRALRIRRRRLVFGAAPAWKVAAAAVAVLGLVATWRAVESPRWRRNRGTVTMLDALRVARAVEAGNADSRWDWNGDGTVDRRDVDVIALRAVAMEVRR